MIYLICLSIFYSLNSHASSINVELDNDILTQTDHYYSNGILIEYENTLLAKEKPWKWLGKGTSYGVGFKHDISTPINTGTELAQPGDHPYSAVLYTTLYTELVSEDYESTCEVLLGLIGPLAFGEQIQNGIHGFLPSHPVNGWANQLKNDILLNYNYEYWKLRGAQAFTYGEWLRAELGTFATQFHFGYQTRSNFLKNHSILLRVGGYLNLFDVKLQGGLFSNSKYALSSDDVKNFNYLAKLSYSYSWRAHKVSLGNTFKGVQFNGGKTHSWTTLAYMYGF